MWNWATALMANGNKCLKVGERLTYHTQAPEIRNRSVEDANKNTLVSNRAFLKLNAMRLCFPFLCHLVGYERTFGTSICADLHLSRHFFFNFLSSHAAFRISDTFAVV